jgi:hypothetical protein
VDDLANDTTDVTVLLSKVEVPETSGVLVVVRVGLEDPTRLPLGKNDTLSGVSILEQYFRARGTYTHDLRQCQ